MHGQQRRCWKLQFKVLPVLVLLAPGVLHGQSAQDWLRQSGLSDDDVAKLEGGEPLVWVPIVDDQAEVTQLAVIRIEATALDITGAARELAGLVQRNEQVLQVGTFSEIPTWEDARELRMPEDDIEDLRKCEIGDCAVKFSAPGIESLHDSVDWAASDHADQANRYLASWLAAYVAGYQDRGSEALAVYADKEETRSAAESLAILLRKTDLLAEYDEKFVDYLEQYPAVESEDAEDLFYWTVEDLSLKPTLFVHHMSIRGGDRPSALIVSKQIWASHYILAGVKAYAAVPASDDDPSQGVYVLLAHRLRFDGPVGGIKRKLLESSANKATTAQLRSFKTYMERTAGG